MVGFFCYFYYMITKERFIEICKEAGLYVTDRVRDDKLCAYLSSRATDGLIARYDYIRHSSSVFVADCIDYHVNNNETYNIYCVGNRMVIDEEKFKTYLDELIGQYKIIKKKLRKKAIEEL